MIYLFDKDEKLIKIVNKKVIKTALQKFALTEERYVSDRLTVEMRMLDDDQLEAVEYMAIQTIEDNHKFHYFYVAQKSSEGTITTLTGVQSGIEELRKSVVLDKRPQDEFARTVIEDLLKDTNWQARFVGETTPHSTNFYYLSTFDALKKVCDVWNLEMQFFVEMNSNKIGARYIDFKQKIGSASGKRVVYGHNALQILQEVERTNIFTALIGRGKGEQVSSTGDVKADGSIQESDGYGRKITIKDVEWSKSAGNPLDKPKGQEYLEWKEMTWKYGIKNADGSMRPKIGFVEFSEEENPEELIKRVYEALIDSARPQLTLKTSTVYLKGAFIGDTIRVVRHDKKIDYDTRIFEITVDRLNDKSSDIKLGDRIAGSESVKAQSQAIANKAIEEFANTEFNNFVKKLPDFIASADGKNTNWGGEEDPTVKYPGKVLINDIWYKPDPEHEGHKIMLRWTGEVWEEILRTGYADIVKERIDKQFEELNNNIAEKEREHNEQVSNVLSKATSAQDLAQQAETISNQAKADAANSIAQASQAKADAIAEATRLTTNVKQSLETQLSQSRQTLSSISGQLSQTQQTLLTQTQQLLAQAQVQTELTKRTEAVEKTADGTKTTLTELSKTVNAQTGQIDSVSKRTKTVEDNLTGLNTRYENLQSGFSNLILKSDDLENPHKQNGAKTTVTSENDYYVITSEGYTSNSWGGMSWNLAIDEVKAGDTFSLLMPVYIDTTVVLDGGIALEIKNHTSQESAFSIWIPTGAKNTWFDVSVTFTVHKDMLLGDYPFYLYIVKNGKVRIKPPTLVRGGIKPSGHIKAEQDIRNQIAEYHQSATENYARLADNVKDVSGKVSNVETTVNQTAGEISQLAKKSELDKANNRLTTAESKITQVNNRITKEISETKALIPETISHRNLAIGSSDQWNSFVPITTNNNWSTNLAVVKYGDSTGIYADTTINVFVYLSADDIVLDNNIPAKFYIQGAVYDKQGNRTWTDWNLYNPVYNKWSSNLIAGNNFRVIKFSTKVTQASFDKISAFELSVRIDGAKSGKFHWRALTITTGDIAPDYWIKPVEDILTDISTVKTTIEQTAEGQQQLSTKVVETADKISKAETKINQLVNDVSSKVSRTDYNNLKGTVDNQSTLIAQNTNQIALKAEKTYVDNVRSTADSAKSTASDALTQAQANNQSIIQTKADLKVTSDKISTLVAKTDFDSATGRLSTLETSIVNQAGEIAKRLTATQVEQTISGKGYQTKSDVDSNITSRGYITSSALQPYATATTVQNIVKESAGSFERRIEETKTLIPSEYSGNILVDSGSGWHNLHIKPFKISEDMWAGSTYTVTTRWWRDDWSNVNFGLRTDKDGYFQWVDLIYRGSIDAWVATFKLNKNISAGTILEFHTVEKNGRGHASWATLVKGSLPMSIWQPSSKDLVTETKFNQVVENVDGIRRLVGNGESLSNAIQSAEKFERSISWGGELYQAIETSKGLAQELTDIEGYKTQVSQLSDSWAVKSLNKAGDVLAALNLNKNGFVVIDSRLVSISGETYIEKGSIKSAAIDSLDAGKIKAGTLDADSVNIINLDASEIRGLNAEFIKAKIETAMIDWMRGKVITASNDAMKIDLNRGEMLFFSNNPAIKRVVSGYPNQFVKFETGGYTQDGRTSIPVSKTFIGSNRGGTESGEDGFFTGLRIWNGSSGNQVADQIDIIGDTIAIQDGAGGVNRSPWVFHNVVDSERKVYFAGNRENGVSHVIGYPGTPINEIHADQIYVGGERLLMMIKDLALAIGHPGANGWVDRIG